MNGCHRSFLEQQRRIEYAEFFRLLDTTENNGNLLAFFEKTPYMFFVIGANCQIPVAVFNRISAETEFREYDKIRAAVFCPPDDLQMACNIFLNVAERIIDLSNGKCEFHHIQKETRRERYKEMLLT